GRNRRHLHHRCHGAGRGWDQHGAGPLIDHARAGCHRHPDRDRDAGLWHHHPGRVGAVLGRRHQHRHASGSQCHWRGDHHHYRPRDGGDRGPRVGGGPPHHHPPPPFHPPPPRLRG